MVNLRQGYWNYDIEARRCYPPLVGSHEADVVVVGGGLSGMWAARDIKTLRPQAEVVLLERDYLGFGPSGRSGGIVYDFWSSLPRLNRFLGPAKARQLAAFSERCTEDIASLPGIDWQRGGALHISTAPAYDNAASGLQQALRAAGREDLFRSLGPEEVATMISSPRWRGGTLYPRVATVHPAKLVRALAREVEGAGVHIYEGAEVQETVRQGAAWQLRTPGGAIRAPSVIRVIGAAENAVIPSSSHMVVSEPLDDIDRFWPGGEAVTDERATVRYMRKTLDNRVAFGWGWGRADDTQDLRRGDPYSSEKVAEVFRAFFPHWQEAKLEFSWGGPVDISPTHLPLIAEREGLWVATGYTGNGMGPTRTIGRILASRALGLDDEAAGIELPRPRLPLPRGRSLLFAGNVVRTALLRSEAAKEAGRRPKFWARVLAALPGKFGVELGR